MKNSMELRNIVKQAWMFIRQYGMSKSEAFKLAWKNFKLKMAMKHRVVKFLFQKVDGTYRTAWGTLIENMLPPTSGKERKPNPTTQCYYDTEKHAYRCFKVANLISFS